MLSDYSLVISEKELNKAQFHLSGEFAARDGGWGQTERKERRNDCDQQE